MAKKVNENKKEVKKSKPKKKHHFGLFIFLTVLAVVVVLPIGFFGIFILDYSTIDVPTSTTFTTDTLKDEIILKSLKNVNSTSELTRGKVILESDENTLNGALSYVVDQINQKSYIPKMYCDIDGNNYTFYLEVQAAFLKTRLVLGTELNFDDGETFTFKINKIGLGKISVPDNILNFVLDKVNLSDSQLEGYFSNAGFHVTVNLKERYISYTRSNFMTDIKTLLTKMGGSDNFYTSILMTLLEKATIGEEPIVDFSTKDSLKFTLDLSKFHEKTEGEGESAKSINTNYEPESLDPYKQIQFNTILGKCEKIISNENNKKLFLDSEKGTLLQDPSSKLFNYLLRGYKYYLAKEMAGDKDAEAMLDFMEQVTFTDVGYDSYNKVPQNEGLSTNGINEIANAVTLYLPDTSATTEIKNIVDKLKDGGTYEIATVSEEKINNYLKTFNMTGTSTVFAGTANGEHLIEYITVDNINFDFVGGEKGVVNFFITLNINGYYVTIYCPLNLIKENPGQLGGAIDVIDFVFDVKNISLGNVTISEISEELLTKLLDALSSSFPKIESTSVKPFEFGQKDGNYILRINLNSLIKTTSYLDIKDQIETALKTLSISFDINNEENKISINAKAV